LHDNPVDPSASDPTNPDRTPALPRPRRFTEQIQLRKLFERDPIFSALSDKPAARVFVTARKQCPLA
jgi:hypothetical protein